MSGLPLPRPQPGEGRGEGALRDAEPRDWLAAAETFADVLGVLAGPPLTVDPKGDPILWAAWAGGATHVVSNDQVLLGVKHYRGAQVLEPGDFLRAWRASR